VSIRRTVQPASTRVSVTTEPTATTSVVRASAPQAGEACHVTNHVRRTSTAWTASTSAFVRTVLAAILSQADASALLGGSGTNVCSLVNLDSGENSAKKYLVIVICILKLLLV